MSKFIKTSLMIIGGLAVLCVVLAVIIGRGGQSTTTITPAQQATSGSVATSVPATTQAQEPAKAQPTESAQPTQEPAKALAIGNIGDRVESAGVALSVLKVERKNELGQFLKADQGKTYVVVEVVVENAGRDDPIPYNPLYFKLKDGDGFEYDPSIIGPDNSLKSGELPKGDKARGVVAFEVPEGAKGLVMQYKPLVLFSNYETIRFQLGE